MKMNKTYCIDNLSLMKKIPNNFIDLIYCDILYGTERNFNNYQDIKPNTNNKVPKGVKSYLDSYCPDYWNIPIINPMDKSEKVDFQTQKPEKLLERIIKASSNENDLIADFFCGSGTTLAVAKKLNRIFIGCDISKKAVEISNKRLKDARLIGFFNSK